MKKKLGIVMVLLCILVAGAVVYLVSGAKKLYTQVDNRRYQEAAGSDGYGMKYTYTLEAFDEKGESKEINFKTSKILKEGAYLELSYIPMRGVTNWIEVNYIELPEYVQNKYRNE